MNLWHERPGWHCVALKQRKFSLRRQDHVTDLAGYKFTFVTGQWLPPSPQISTWQSSILAHGYASQYITLRRAETKRQCNFMTSPMSPHYTTVIAPPPAISVQLLLLLLLACRTFKNLVSEVFCDASWNLRINRSGPLKSTQNLNYYKGITLVT
jgi:hypothetical protein